MTQSTPVNGIVIQGSEAHKIAQAIYHSVTGKTEKLTKAYSDNYKITFEDIEQLNAKCKQMFTQWLVLESNENITINHINDNKENFTSLERFKIYDRSQTSAIESIIYELNILIKPNGNHKPQPYKITIRLSSAIGIFAKEEDDMPSHFLLKFFQTGPLVIEIEYVDYVIARNILATIESWVKEIEIETKSKALKLIQNNSHWIPKISSSLLLFIASIATFFSIDTVLIGHEENSLLAKFLVISFVFIAFSYILGGWLGKLTENTVDRIRELSHIEINRGDKNLLAKYKKNNNKSYLKTFVYVILISIHAISCSYLATIIYEHLK